MNNLAPPPSSMDALPRDRRGLPVPHIAAWSSETWDVARADLLIQGHPMALYSSGRQGRGIPHFDVINEERQRRAVLLGRCQVCDEILPRQRGGIRYYGWLPSTTLTSESRGHLEDGTPVVSEPLLCYPCCEWTISGCCQIARSDEVGMIRVDAFERVLQLVDPSAAPPSKLKGRRDDMAARQRLGLIARRCDPPGLVGFVKLALTDYREVKEP